MPVGAEDNRAYLDMLRENGPEIDEIPAFMASYSESSSWDRRVSEIERFCQGALSDPGMPIEDRVGTGQTSNPIAWISDLCDGLDRPPFHRTNSRLLDKYEFYEALRKV
ncbi:hypothetical protein IL306_007328, partial [Fusarium sp. DS 682]